MQQNVFHPYDDIPSRMTCFDELTWARRGSNPPSYELKQLAPIFDSYAHRRGVPELLIFWNIYFGGVPHFMNRNGTDRHSYANFCTVEETQQTDKTLMLEDIYRYCFSLKGFRSGEG